MTRLLPLFADALTAEVVLKNSSPDGKMETTLLHCRLSRQYPVVRFTTVKNGSQTKSIWVFIIPLLRHFTLFGQENAQNMRQ